MWVVNTLDDNVSQISHDTNSVVDTIQVGDDPADIAVAGGIVWVANEADGTLSRIEPGQSSASSTVIESAPQGMASWEAICGSRFVIRRLLTGEAR